MIHNICIDCYARVEGIGCTASRKENMTERTAIMELFAEYPQTEFEIRMTKCERKIPGLPENMQEQCGFSRKEQPKKVLNLEDFKQVVAGDVQSQYPTVDYLASTISRFIEKHKDMIDSH